MKNSPDALKQYVVMVDPYTSSERICDALLEKNIYPMALFTDRIQMPSEAKKTRLPQHKFDKIYAINAANFNEVIDQIRQYTILRVVSGCELSNDIADRIAFELCPDTANPLATSKIRMDKFEMQETLRSKKLNAVKQIKVSALDLSDAQKKQLALFTFPVIIKPVSANGSFGVFKCENVSAVEQAVSQVMGKLYKNFGVSVDEMVIQECLQGVEYIVDTVSFQGKHKIISVQKYYKSLYKDRPIYRWAEIVDNQSDVATVCIDYVKKVLSIFIC